MTDKLKQRILNLLKGNKEMSQTEIASHLKRNYYEVTETLEEMEKEKKLISHRFKQYIFWRRWQE